MFPPLKIKDFFLLLSNRQKEFLMVRGTVLQPLGVLSRDFLTCL